MQDWIRVHSGGRFHFLRPNMREVKIEDICHALSHICRFTGQCRTHYSVGMHSCLVSDILPKELKLCGLLHDGSEAYCNDLASPLKAVLPQYAEIENRIQKVIARKWRLPYPFPAAVKSADMALLCTEIRDLIPKGEWRDYPYTPLEMTIKPWSIEQTRREFMRRFRKLSP
jgi:hypothetical protein